MVDRTPRNYAKRTYDQLSDDTLRSLASRGDRKAQAELDKRKSPSTAKDNHSGFGW